MPEALWRGMRPTLTRDNEQALEVWDFCGGWNPERIPMAAAFYGINDLGELVTRLLAIRDRVEAHGRAQREAAGGKR